jgi:hypothetical protein
VLLLKKSKVLAIWQGGNVMQSRRFVYWWFKMLMSGRFGMPRKRPPNEMAFATHPLRLLGQPIHNLMSLDNLDVGLTFDGVIGPDVPF